MSIKIINEILMVWVIFGVVWKLEGVTCDLSPLTNLADVECGQQAVKVNPKLRAPRIGGGLEAYRGEFPWIVSLQYAARRDDNQKHFCGGFLINSRYVLSAAHCFQYIVRERFNVLIGEYRIGHIEEPHDAITISVEDILVHPKFGPMDTTRHDIALLRLNQSVEWTPFVQPACLPNPEVEVFASLKGELASMAGWGYTNDDEPVVSETLMAVEVPIVDNHDCQEEYEWVGSETQLCAGTKLSGQGACKGDSGSPLMTKTKTRSDEVLSVVGIHAGGHGCGLLMLPGIYTRVSSYVDWIKSNIRS